MSVMSQFDSDRVKMFDKMLLKMSSYIFINTICCLVAVTSDSFATLLTMAHQAPLSMGFPRQEYWSGLPFPSSGDLPNPGIELASPTLQTDCLPSEPPGSSEIRPTWFSILAVLPLGDLMTSTFLSFSFLFQRVRIIIFSQVYVVRIQHCIQGPSIVPDSGEWKSCWFC